MKGRDVCLGVVGVRDRGGGGHKWVVVAVRTVQIEVDARGASAPRSPAPVSVTSKISGENNSMSI